MITGHPPILESRTLAWPDEAACEATARAVAAHLLAPDAYIELHGTLGAGKTTFTRHLLHALGVTGRVKSPTYTVVEPYESAERPGLAIFHFDFYRFDDPQEWEDAGFRDIFAAPGLKIAEWPEKAAGLLPLADLQVFIEIADDDTHQDARRVRLLAATERGRGLLP